MTEDLDSLVRRVDEDRWLASRFAPTDVRARLVSLYAVNFEIARLGETVREAPLGDIRLAWWRSALCEIADGGAPRAHPALEALHRTGGAGVARALMASVEARAADFEAAPFATWDALERYVHGTAGVLLRAALEACGIGTLGGEQEYFAERAAAAWAFTGLLRAAPIWSGRGRSFLLDGVSEADLMARARENYAAAKPLARLMPAAAFPAFGYVVLVPGYLRALDRGQRERPLLARQVSIIASSATGRI